MLILISLFALLLGVAGVILLIKPAFVLDFIGRNADSYGLFAAAIVMRLALGGLLVYLAELSRYPLTIACIGWIAIATAIVFAALGKRRFTLMLNRIMQVIRPRGRAGGLAALLLSAFLFYAFI